MMSFFRRMTIEQLGNIFEFAGVIIMLLLALFFQFWLGELPCPLCLLQRVGFIGVAFGFILNFRFGFRPSHYSIILLSALFTSFVALRQVALHVIPGTGAYGSPIFGMHLYTWSFIFAMLIVIITAVLLGFDRQYKATEPSSRLWLYIVRTLYVVMVFIIIANLVSVFLECGFHECPDNPESYSLTL